MLTVYVEILILDRLESGQKHGYEIKKDIENILGKDFSINNNMLYPILKRLEDMGAVQKQIEQQEGKPNRHVYTITSIGTELFFDLLQDFPEEIASNNNEFLVRVGLFNLLDLRTRKTILQTRKNVVEKNLRQVETIVQTHHINIAYPFPFKVIEFQKAQIKLELQWISELEKECGEEL